MVMLMGPIRGFFLRNSGCDQSGRGEKEDGELLGEHFDGQVGWQTGMYRGCPIDINKQQRSVNPGAEYGYKRKKKALPQPAGKYKA